MQEPQIAETNQVETQNSLSLSSDLYTDLANALPSGIYRLRVFRNVSSNKDKWLSSRDVPYIVEFTNDRYIEILQLDRAEFEKNPGVVQDLILEDDKPEFARLNVECNRHIIPFLWEGRVLIKGKVIWIRFKSIPRVLECGDIVWTGTLEDITYRKLIEEDIKFKNAELLRLNADKDYFISILAHDLKTPFNSILGFLDLLLSHLHSFDIDQIERQLMVVQNSANNAFLLLEDILGWALSQSGKLPFEPRMFNLKLICDEVIEMLRPNANSKNLTLNSIETDHVMAYADMNMLNTILRNLISNAIKFTNRGGTISISSEQLNSELVISVADTGIGISPEHLPRLFDNSQIQSQNGTANEKGTGLGLLLCEMFIAKHGGKIWAESTLGQGSVFKFTLPFHQN